MRIINVISKGIVLLSLFFGLLSAVSVRPGVLSDSCTAGGAVIASEPYSASTSIDISQMFSFSGTYSVSLRTSWSGRMWCGTGMLLDDVYYFSPAMGAPSGTYIGFSHSDTGETTYFQVIVEPAKSYEGVNGLPGSHSLGYQVDYTITFTLVNKVPSGATLISSDSGVVTIGTIAASGQKRSDSDAYDRWASNNWGKKRWLTYQNLNVSFKATNTTCSIPSYTFTMPETSIDAIRNGRAGRKPFILEFQCDGYLNSVATRNVRSWFYSNDRVAEIGNGYVLRNPQSTAQDIGIVLTDYFGRPVRLSDSINQINNADLLLDVEKGKPFEASSDPAYVFATYAIYGPEPSPGSVTATAIVVINYD
ncbi:fimbrial protein [Vibrio cincinnatiensis]|uniref:fimbrial protein n=1 Tax=Vibrio cincinnatiensis TaxID=675 RepID=UPI001FAB0B4F|nr:fimbrial protein [Vibrio cincinnatiensis]